MWASDDDMAIILMIVGSFTSFAMSQGRPQRFCLWGRGGHLGFFECCGRQAFI